MNVVLIGRRLSKGNRSIFDVSVESQRAFLTSLKQPRSNRERSFRQYQCQNFFVPGWKKFLLNFGAIFFYPFCLVYTLFKSLVRKSYEKVDAIGECKGMDEIVPTAVSDRYKINNDLWRCGCYITLADIPFLVSLVGHYFYAPFFVLKCSMKLADYSAMIHNCNPKAIIVHNEYSYTSSVLTEYCNWKGVKHINVMHGEKLYNIRDSFFRYDECYVWSQHYVDLFCELRAEPTQFRIAIPPSMSIQTENYEKPDLYSDLKYYFNTFNEEKLKAILNSMELLLKKGYSIKFRLHPRFSDVALLEKFVDKANIEYPSQVCILESISNCKYAVGLYSTVLCQAYYSGKGVIIDDITLPDQFTKLKDLRYGLLSEPGVLLLSQAVDVLAPK